MQIDKLVDQTWSEVVSKVQKANLDKFAYFREQEKSRKRAYRSELDKQVRELESMHSLEKIRKSRQRSEIEDKIKEENIAKTHNKIMKVKTQQKYQAENLELMKQGFRPYRQFAQQGENPFTRLLKSEEERKKQTKMNFMLQNQLNDIQVKLLKQNSQKAREQEKRARRQYQSFVQSQFQKKDKDRQQFKNKYLSIRKWENSYGQRHQLNQSIQKKYIDFVRKQSQQLKIRRRTDGNVLKGVIAEINRHVEVPDSSPAYLGRGIVSHDRKKQLEMVDHSLYMANRLEGKQERSRQACRSQFGHSYFRNGGSELGADEVSRIFKNKPALPEIRKMSESQALTRQINMRENNSATIQLINNKNPQQNKSSSTDKSRKYQRYDFITGTRKTVAL